MADQFSEGDVVFLKSGGPEMTINSIHSSSGLLTCYYFVQGDLKKVEVKQHSVRKSK